MDWFKQCVWYELYVLSADFKYKRILQIYTRLLKGEVINKSKEAAAANVTERSIQRDLDDLRAFFDE